jgi:uncharacterized protein (DUF433 family)
VGSREEILQDYPDLEPNGAPAAIEEAAHQTEHAARTEA